jgi:hypothetical protein
LSPSGAPRILPSDQVALGGLKAFLDWQAMADETRRTEAADKQKKVARSQFFTSP